MSIKLNDSVRVQGAKPVEDKTLNNGVPYSTVAEARSLIAKTDRYPGLPVIVKNLNGGNDEWWWKEGVEDSNLIVKTVDVDLSDYVTSSDFRDLAAAVSGKVDLDGSNITDPEGFKKSIGLGKYSYETGGVTTTLNLITLELKSGGNKLIYNGSTFIKATKSEFSYTAVTAGKIKKLVIYGRPITPFFFFAEGVEGNQATDPTLPSDAFVIYEIIAKDNEQTTTGGGTSTGISLPGASAPRQLLESVSTTPNNVRWFTHDFLSKPTTTGSWIPTRSADGTITYTNANNFGQNIFTTNLTLGANRTHNLGGFKMLFQGGRFAVDYLYLEVKTADSIPDKLWYDGSYVWLNQSTGISARVLIDRTVTGIFNPPTLAQLTTLGIKKGEFYKNTTTNQIAFFNGEQLGEWTVTTAVWNTLTTDQKNAVKNFNVIL